MSLEPNKARYLFVMLWWNYELHDMINNERRFEQYLCEVKEFCDLIQLLEIEEWGQRKHYNWLKWSKVKIGNMCSALVMLGMIYEVGLDKRKLSFYFFFEGEALPEMENIFHVFIYRLYEFKIPVVFLDFCL